MNQAENTRPGQDAIARLLRPRSVAIIGASPTPGSLGASVLANLERLGFAGDIHLVNPRRSEIAGRPACPRPTTCRTAWTAPCWPSPAPASWTR